MWANADYILEEVSIWEESVFTLGFVDASHPRIDSTILEQYK
jgi:hypothetical protein